MNKVIVFTTDAGRHPLRWLACALKSVKRHLGDLGVKVVVLTTDPDGVAPAVEESMLNDVVVADVRDTMREYGFERFKELTFMGHSVPPIQVYRIALAVEPALSAYDKVVFCDTDVRIESPEWGKIFDEDVSDCDVAGVMDGNHYPKMREGACKTLLESPVMSRSYVPESSKERIRNCVYCAAGVLVMNLKRIRTAYGDCRELLRNMIDACCEYKFSQLDQSMINLFLKVKIIPFKYNFWGTKAHEGLSGALLRHFPGQRKCHQWFYPFDAPYESPNAVDIVYSVGKADEKTDRMLMWSLRSVAKYGRGVRRVIVSSPSVRPWLSDHVIQARSIDRHADGDDARNRIGRVLAAIDDADIHNEVLVSSGREVWLRETDFASMPVPYVAEQLDSATDALLQSKRFPRLNFRVREMCRWQADLVRDMRSLFESARDGGKEMDVDSLMGNAWVSVQDGVPLDFVSEKDIRAIRRGEIADGYPCLPLHPDAFGDAELVEMLDKAYGEKCRYET